MSILVGDIGGTNVRLAMASPGKGALPALSDIWRAPAADFPEFSDALDTFLSEDLSRTNHGPSSAVFALAGPVSGDTIALTNNHWVIRRQALREHFGFEHLHLMNDFAAMARSVPALPGSAFHILQAGDPDAGHPIAVAGAGTGLGQAMLTYNKNGRWDVFPGEGGHQSYAPQTPLQCEIALALQKRYGHVSAELICSGRGLPRIYGALAEIEDGQYMDAMDAKTITDSAQAGDARAQQCCHIAAHALMGFIGDAVLAAGAWSGAVLAGGVSQHLRDYLGTPEALSQFYTKGAMTRRMKSVPLSLLIDNRAPLIGAAIFDPDLI
ncbi:glucokinase [Robiginitomaculum antarcticum]|uniref:glucokinase n=1 Tax=Robiginitomaculum antarcticum TaxID=437507 RepID=UPI000381E22C|nr:glucokinase [Robiginitomaculum antarcticum]